MKKVLSATLIACVAMLCCTESSAQRTKYPEKNKAFLEATDAASSLEYDKMPLIGIPPQNDGSEGLAILKAGGIPVIVSLQTDRFGVMRDLAANLDGFVLTDSYCKAVDNAASKGGSTSEMLLLKALMDRNVPMLGTCATKQSWNKGMMRQEDGLADVSALVSKAKTYKHAKALMAAIMSVDTHCDLPGRYRRGYSVGTRTACQGCVPKMDEGGLSSMVIISYVGHETVQKKGPEGAVAAAQGELDKAFKDIEANSAYCGFARTSAEARELKAQGKKAYFLGVENGSALGGDIKNVKKYADQGVIYITLSHMYDNDVCNSSSHTADGSKGLTAFGREVVKEMNRLGVMIDCSHTSEGTFWDCIRESAVPFVCSHSGAMAEWKHNRNLTDEQLKALAQKDGVIQVYIVQDYMSKDDTASLDTFMEHLNHCVKVAGVDHVGIGADFDGGGGGWGLNGANDHINVTVKMIECGYSDSDIAKMWGGNFFRVMDAVQAYKK